MDVKGFNWQRLILHRGPQSSILIRAWSLVLWSAEYCTGIECTVDRGLGSLGSLWVIYSPLVLHGKELKWDREGRVEGSVSEADYVNPSGNLEIWKIVSAIRTAEEGKKWSREKGVGEKRDDKDCRGSQGLGQEGVKRRNQVQREVRDPSRKSTISNLTASDSSHLIHDPGNWKDYSTLGDMSGAGAWWETWDCDQKCFLAVE